MNFVRSKRGLAAAAVVVLLALYTARPGANRLRTRIVNSLSLAVGRPIEVEAVNLRLLPQPGFVLRNFVVHEDPDFGVEPILRADEVTATIRVTSLLRGRLEIARLSFTEPSLNLVHNAAGHWNLERLLQRAQETQAAPTSKPKSEPRPAFPYIQADRSRLNFKLGAEKMPYALTNADFSLWQDSENTWGMRLKAQPMRTDLNLSDTGIIQVEGSWDRAAALQETPLQFTVGWERAQLGQLSKLSYGRDPGWRGALRSTIVLKGTPADLSIQADAAIEDFHRYDLTDGNSLLLLAHCDGQFTSVTYALPSFSCRSAVSGGLVTLEGSIGPFQQRNYDLSLSAQDVPLQSLVAFARHAKRGIPVDLLASGAVEGNFKFQRSAGHSEAVNWTGRGAARGVRIVSRSAKADLALERIPFSISVHHAINGNEDKKSSAELFPRLEAGPFSLLLGRPTPVVVRGDFSRAGYDVGLQGEAQIQRLFPLARILGLPLAQPVADGIARIDLQLAGAWSAFTAPQLGGKAQLRSVRAEIRGLNQPLEISAANVFLLPGEVDVRNLSASLGESTWHGSLALPRQCAEAGTCPVRFDLHAETVATEWFAAMLNNGGRNQRWYQFLSSGQPGVPFLRSLRASGKLSVNHVTVHKLQATSVSSNIELQNGRLRFSDLQADVLGGHHTGEWTADFSVKPPAYSGTGTFQDAGLSELAALMHDGWVTGTAQGTYRLTSSGWTWPDLMESAAASLDVHAVDGTLPHIALAAGSAGTVMRAFDGKWLLRNGKFEIQQGKLETTGGIYQVSGTVSLARVLDLKLTREGVGGFEITGPLTEPHVLQTAAETRAALKP